MVKPSCCQLAAAASRSFTATTAWSIPAMLLMVTLARCPCRQTAGWVEPLRNPSCLPHSRRVSAFALQAPADKVRFCSTHPTIGPGGSLMPSENIRMPQSLWAAVTPAGPELPQLVGTVQADVVIIGAGFTGLSTALHLREAGIDVAIVEAAEPGWGGSGRNNGQVIPTLTRPDPEDIVAKHRASGERFVALLRDCASTLFDVIRRYQIQAEQEQAGWIQPVHSPGRIRIAERRVRQWSKAGAPVEFLSREDVTKMLGSDAWFGGFWNRTGGHINPLALSRGLARAALDRGGRIYARSPASKFERVNNRWIVTTPHGEISGRALILATNAYTGEFEKQLAPDIAREVMPVRSWQMATAPLSEAARKSVIPGRQAMSDTHGELYFARYDARNRLVTGGALVGTDTERLKAAVGARLKRLWPEIGDVKF